MTWERLGDLLRDPARRTNNSRRGTEPRWLVSVFARCGVCGGQLRVGGAGRGRGPAYVGAECGHLRRDAAMVDDLIGELVIGWLERYADSDRLRPQPPAADANTRALRGEARRLRARREQFRALGEDGDMDPADVAATLRGIDAKLVAIDGRLAAATSEPNPLEGLRTGSPARAAWEALPMANRRNVVQILMASVVIHRAGRGRVAGPDTIELTWRKDAAGA